MLGLPLLGGPFSYRSAERLELPTWASSDLEPLLDAWPGVRTIWVQFSDSLIGRYDYSTGHLLAFEESSGPVRLALALADASGLVVGRGDGVLELIGGPERWSYALEGRLTSLESAGEGRFVAVVEQAAGAELLLMQPPQAEPIARRRVSGVRDLVVTAWGTKIYYLPTDGERVVHGLTLPDLEEGEDFALAEAGEAIAATPSSHRLYVSASRSLSVFDRLRGEKLKDVPLPGEITSMRFGPTGAKLLGRLASEGAVAVIQVGVDSVLGVIAAEWGDNLPVALPGDRMIARQESALLLYDLSSLLEIARIELEDPRIWLPVEWQPPRPRLELAHRTSVPAASQMEATSVEPVEEGVANDSSATHVEMDAPPGYYAVVLAARTQPGVDDLVAWLKGVGYSSIRDRHEDVMGVVWFRAMVGPYPNRSRAESAARSLGARYGYKPWILSIDEPESASPAESDSVAAEPIGLP